MGDCQALLLGRCPGRPSLAGAEGPGTAVGAIIRALDPPIS